jgi:hypothetical protein
MVLITPTFPFKAPPIVRKNIAWRKDFEKPNPKTEMAVTMSTTVYSNSDLKEQLMFAYLSQKVRLI